MIIQWNTESFLKVLKTSMHYYVLLLLKLYDFIQLHKKVQITDHCIFSTIETYLGNDH